MAAKVLGAKSESRSIPAGCAFDKALACDEAYPGFLRFLARASSLRRQGIFFLFNYINWEQPSRVAEQIAGIQERWVQVDADARAVIARGLISFRVRDLIHAVCGPVPVGFLGALQKCGPDPMDGLCYEMLWSLFNDTENAPRAALLRQLDQINDDVVEVVWQLPAALLHPSVLQIVHHAEHIDQYRAVIKLVRRLHPQITDETLALSIGHMPTGSTLGAWATRWVEKSDCLTGDLPYAGGSTIRPLVSAADLKTASRKYRNCLGSKIGVVALGRAAYYECFEGQGAIAEIAALSRGQWVLEGIYGPGNNQPAPEIVRSMRKALESAGVLVPAKHTHGKEMEEVARILRVFDFNGGSWLEVEEAQSAAALL